MAGGRRIRGTLAALTVAAGLLAPVAGAAPTACAGDGPHAALVIAHDGRALELCVALDAERVTGLHLIELADEQHGLDHAFGYGGQAVCRLDGVGTASENCFEEDDPFYWAYFRLEEGRWTYSPLGAGSTLVEDGDVEGWAWGRGGASSHPRPPLRSFADVCGEEEPPASPSAGEPGGAGTGPVPSPSPTPPPSPEGGTGGGRGGASGDGRGSPGTGEARVRPGPQGGRAPADAPAGTRGDRALAAGAAADAGEPGGADRPWSAGVWASLAMSSGLLLLAARRARRSP